MKKIAKYVTSLLIIILCFLCGCYFGDFGDFGDFSDFGDFEIGIDEENKNNVFYLGEVAKNTKEIEFQVFGVGDTQEVGSGFLTNKTDNNFVIVWLQITNNSNTAYSVNSYNFTLLKGDAEYEQTLTLIEDELTYDTLNPGISKKYFIIFETNSKSEEEHYTLKCSEGLFSNKYVLLNLFEKD